MSITVRCTVSEVEHIDLIISSKRQQLSKCYVRIRLLTFDSSLQTIDGTLSFCACIVYLLICFTAASFKEEVQTAFCKYFSLFRRVSR